MSELSHDRRQNAIGRKAGYYVRAAQARLEDAAVFLADASFVVDDNKAAQRLAGLSRAASLAAEPLSQIVRNLRRPKREVSL